MNKQSNTYIVLYATVMVVIVAAVLSFAAIKLQPLQQQNVKIEKMSSILGSIGQGQDAATAANKDQYIIDQYSKYITESFMVNNQGEKVEGDAFKALNNLAEVFAAPAAERAVPVFIATLDGGKKLYIVPMMGRGLWGPVWGYISLNADCNTIEGAIFDHKSETPGLGAEIALPAFESQFVGKQIFKDGKFVSINLSKGKGSSAGNQYAVDAISGGTLTSNGVKDMLQKCLSDYVPYFEKVSAAGNSVPMTDLVPADTVTTTNEGGVK